MHCCSLNPTQRQRPNQPGPTQPYPALSLQRAYSTRCHVPKLALSVATGTVLAVPGATTCPSNPTSHTQAAVSIVHQEVSTQSPRCVVVHAARAVGHIAHHHRLGVREPAGGTTAKVAPGWHQGGIRVAPSWHTSSLPSAGVPSPAVSPPARDAVRTGGPLGTQRGGRALATLRDVNMIKLESANPPLQLGKAVCNSADYPLIK